MYGYFHDVSILKTLENGTIGLTAVTLSDLQSLGCHPLTDMPVNPLALVFFFAYAGAHA